MFCQRMAPNAVSRKAFGSLEVTAGHSRGFSFLLQIVVTYNGVILSVAVLQPERRACPERNREGTLLLIRPRA